MFKSVSLYDEMVNYELAWASDVKSSLKNINIGNSLFCDELVEKIKNFIDNKLDKNFSILVPQCFQFPPNLENSTVKALYYQGDLGLLDNNMLKISIVGARKASSDGVKRARQLVKKLLNKGDIIIVSGLADGIDTAAMNATVEFGGHMIGVIGTPLNKFYPKQNEELQRLVADKHLLLSHVPFYKYSLQKFDTQKYYFPERNTVMAAISDATVIVEASETSGTLTQARACLEMGKKLFILNSCFESGLKWPDKYEKKGAIRVRTIEDIWENLNVKF